MKYYKNYTAKKFKLPKRILFFVICAVIIFIFTIILGNSLKKRLAEADIDTTPVTTPETTNQTDIADVGGSAAHDSELSGVKAGYLDLVGVADTAAIKERIADIKNKGFNCISFTATSDTGLTYASPAAEKLSRLTANPSLVSYQILSDAVKIAKQQGLRTSALFAKGNNTVDEAVATELAGLGFDEIIVLGFDDVLGENGGDISAVVEYLKMIRKAAPDTDISLSLKPEAYTYARNSYQLEKLYTYTEFLSINLCSVDKTRAGELADKLSGSYFAYILRSLVLGTDTDAVNELVNHSVNGIQYMTALPKPPETTDSAETTGKKG